MAEETVVLVDPHDNAIGELPKLQAHREGRLHRAVSVFLFNDRGEMLLQRRAAGKYHSAGLWSNACCTHPRPAETAHAAALRRLMEEMGISCPLRHHFTFLYRADLGGGLSEHELDHVFVGTTNDDPRPDPDEVGGWRWVPLAALTEELRANPAAFTAWFPLALAELEKHSRS